jgi:hypothetical protein
VPDAAADENVELGSLMDAAAAALREEDKTVAGLIETARAKEPESPEHRSTTGAGRGLSYWVYETTLVYTVWRGDVLDVPAAPRRAPEGAWKAQRA